MNISIIAFWMLFYFIFTGVSIAYGQTVNDTHDLIYKQCLDMASQGIQVNTNSTCVETMGLAEPGLGEDFLAGPEIDSTTI